MNEGQIIDIYNQGVSEVIGLIKELLNQNFRLLKVNTYWKSIWSNVCLKGFANLGVPPLFLSYIDLKIISYCKLDKLFYNKG